MTVLTGAKAEFCIYERGLNMSIKAKTRVEEDHCPMCDATDLYYGERDWHGDQFSQDVVCNGCEFEFKQWYIAKFSGMTTIIQGQWGNIDIENP